MAKINNYRKIEVLEPQNHPLYKFTLYKVMYQSMDGENKLEITVYKRFSDFKKLYDQMSLVHLNLHRTNAFPNFVKANFFDRFDEDVIELRRKSSENLLKFICENKHLYNHKYFQDFLSSGVRKYINNEDNLFDKALDDFNIEGSLPSPILPVPLLYQRRQTLPSATLPDSLPYHQSKSLDKSTSNNFDNVDTYEEFRSKSTSSIDASSDNSGSYLELASKLLIEAEVMENENNWNVALSHYENLIGILLKGAKMDKNKVRVSLVHKQIRLHLDKAEWINKTYLCNHQENDDDVLLKLLDQCIVLKSNNNNEVM